MNTKQLLAFEMLEQEMELIRRDELMGLKGGDSSWGYGGSTGGGFGSTGSGYGSKTGYMGAGGVWYSFNGSTGN